MVGYLVALLLALGLTNYPVGHLLLGGAILGVILGIAAQQSLGNVFAGLVLLAARPFTVRKLFSISGSDRELSAASSMARCSRSASRTSPWPRPRAC